MPLVVNISHSLRSKSLKSSILSGASSPQFSTIAITSVCFYLMRPSPDRDQASVLPVPEEEEDSVSAGTQRTVFPCFLILSPPSSHSLPCDLLLLPSRSSSYGLSPSIHLSDPFPPHSSPVPLSVSVAGIPNVTVTGAPPCLCPFYAPTQ